MEFMFYCLANDGEELVKKTDDTLAGFFPSCKWTYGLIRVEQVKQEPVVKKRWLFKSVTQPTQILFQVTVEVFSKGLNNALVSTRKINDNEDSKMKKEQNQIGY